MKFKIQLLTKEISQVLKKVKSGVDVELSLSEYTFTIHSCNTISLNQNSNIALFTALDTFALL
jgi:hypothetical protein